MFFVRSWSRIPWKPPILHKVVNYLLLVQIKLQQRLRDLAELGWAVATPDGTPHSLELEEPAVGKSHNGEKVEDAMPEADTPQTCLLYTSPSPRDRTRSRMPSSA